MLQAIKQVLFALSFAVCILRVKPDTVRQVHFFGKEKYDKALEAIVDAVQQYEEARGDSENAKALEVAAKQELSVTCEQLRDSEIQIEPRASNGTFAKRIFDALVTRGYAYGTVKNYVSALRVAVNEGRPFDLNPSRKRSGGKSKGKGGRERLIEKTKTTYSINAKSDTPTAKIVAAIKQFGEFIRSSAAAEDSERLALAAYLADVDDVAKSGSAE